MGRLQHTSANVVPSRRRWRKPVARLLVALLLGAATTMGVAWWMASRWGSGTPQWAQMMVMAPGRMTWVVREERLGGRRAREVGASPSGFWSETLAERVEQRETVSFKAELKGDNCSAAEALSRALAAMPERVDIAERSAFLRTPVGAAITSGWGRVPDPVAVGNTVDTYSFACGWPTVSCWGWQSRTYASTTPAQTPKAPTITPIALETVGLLRPPPVGMSAPSLGWPNGLPFLPVWPGFLVSTLFYALPWWLLLLLLLPGAALRDWRRKHDQCVHCGYSLAGLARKGDSLTCPECGARHTPSPPPQRGAGE